jgi:hypothetical protein
MQHLLLRRKNRHDHVKHVCMTWQLWRNATYPKLSGIGIPTHTYMVQVVLLPTIYLLISMAKQGMGVLHKIKWSGETIIGNSQLLHILLLCEMQTITERHGARCKQVYEYYIQILHIFLIQKHIEYFLFRVMDQKIWIYQDLHICRNL